MAQGGPHILDECQTDAILNNEESESRISNLLNQLKDLMTRKNEMTEEFIEKEKKLKEALRHEITALRNSSSASCEEWRDNEYLNVLDGILDKETELGVDSGDESVQPERVLLDQHNEMQERIRQLENVLGDRESQLRENRVLIDQQRQKNGAQTVFILKLPSFLPYGLLVLAGSACIWLLLRSPDTIVVNNYTTNNVFPEVPKKYLPEIVKKYVL